MDLDILDRTPSHQFPSAAALLVRLPFHPSTLLPSLTTDHLLSTTQTIAVSFEKTGRYRLHDPSIATAISSDPSLFPSPPFPVSPESLPSPSSTRLPEGRTSELVGGRGCRVSRATAGNRRGANAKGASHASSLLSLSLLCSDPSQGLHWHWHYH